MGGSSTTQQTVTIPPEVLARYNAVNNEAQGLMSTPFQTYGGEFVSPVNATQQGGINQISQNANAAQPYYGAATGVAGAALGAASPITGQQINQYMSPYLGDVVGSESALLNQNNQQAMAGQLGNAISSGAFGGDRAGIAAANLNQQQQIANANIYSNLLNTGYNTALQTAQQQQAQQVGAYQTGANQLAALGAGAQSAALQGGQAQIAAGQVQQQTQQAQDTALYNQFLQHQAYPFQQVQFAANIAEGTGALSGQTQTTNQPGAMLARGGRAGKAYGGGLSEGGNVLPQHAGEGFAVGGLAGYDPSAWASILSGQHPGAPVGGIGGTGLMAQATAGGGQHYTLPSIAAPKAQEPGALTKGLESGVSSAVDSKLKSMLEKPKPPADTGVKPNAPTGVNPDVSAMSHEGEHAPDAGSNSDTQVAPAQGAEAPPADASHDVSSVADDSNAPDFSDMGEKRGGRIGLAGGGVTGAEVNAAMPYGGGGNDALESLDTAGASNASLPTLAAAPKPSGGILDSIMGDVAKIGIQYAMSGAKRGGAIKGYADGGTPGYGELGMISSLFSDPALRQIMLNAMKQKPASDDDADLLKDPASDIGNEQEAPKSEDVGLAAAPTPANSAPAPTGLVPAKAAEAKAPANISKIASMIAASEGTGKNPIPGSSAMGKGQFVNKTFRSYAAKVDPALAQKIAGMSNSELTAYRQQHAAELTDAQSKMYDTYTKENYDRLTKAGITPDAGSMYLAHAVPAVAPSILTADPNTPLRKYLKPDEISQNWRIFGGTKGRDVNEYTTGDAIRGTRARMAQFENKFAAGGLVGRKGYALGRTVDDGSDDGTGDATGLAPTDADLVPESKIEQGPGKRTLADALSAIDSSDLTNKASAPKVGLNAATPPPADDSAQNAAAGAAQGAASAVPMPAGLASGTPADKPTSNADNGADTDELNKAAISSATDFVNAARGNAKRAPAERFQDLLQNNVSPKQAYEQVYGTTDASNLGSLVQGVKHGSANAILPILTGLAGAATARTRNFGTALLAGLGQGAAAYQNQRNFAVESDVAQRESLANQAKALAEQQNVNYFGQKMPYEIAGLANKAFADNVAAKRVQYLLPAEYNAEVAKGYLTYNNPNGGYYAIHPATGKVIALGPQPAGTEGSPTPVGVSTLPTNQKPVPAYSPSPNTVGAQTKGGPQPTPAGKTARQVPQTGQAGQPVTQGRWKPDTSAGDELFTDPSFHVNKWALSPIDKQAILDRQSTVPKELEANRASATGAAAVIPKLDRMTADILSPANKGFLTPGAGGQGRLEIGKRVNAALQSFGFPALFNTAPGEELGKLNTTTAAELAEHLSGRFGSSILKSMTTATPGFENSPVAGVLIAEALKQEAMRNQHYSEFSSNYALHNPIHTLDGVTDAFNRKNPADAYLKQARFQAAIKLMGSAVAGGDEDARDLFAHISNPKAVEAARRKYDAIYGNGFIRTLTGK